MSTLTNKQIENLKGKDKPYRILDSNGLYLNIGVSGNKSWQYRYQVYENDKRKDRWFTIGKYPNLTLKQARAEHTRLVFEREKGIDVQVTKIARRKIQNNTTNKDTLKNMAQRYLDMRKGKVVESTLDKDTSRIERFLLPVFGQKKLEDIQAQDLLEHLMKVSETNGKETAVRTMNQASQILEYAFSLGKVKYNVARGMAKYLPTPETKHHPIIKEEMKLGEIIYLMEHNDRNRDVCGLAVRTIPHIFLRISEILSMKWTDVDFRKKIWETDISKTKRKGVEHIRVFLSDHVISLLKQCRDLTGDKEFVFHGANRKGQVDDSTVRNRMTLIGIPKDTVKPHGFRGTAMSMGQDELKFDSRTIDFCMAHKTKNPLGTAYDRAEQLEERKLFMNAWSQYLLDSMKKYQKSMSKLRAV